MHDQIIVYSQPNCPMCEMLKGKLNQAKIPFVVEMGADKLLAKGIKHVPMVEGFDGQMYNLKETLEHLDAFVVSPQAGD